MLVTWAFFGQVPPQNGCKQWSLASACRGHKSHCDPEA